MVDKGRRREEVEVDVIVDLRRGFERRVDAMTLEAIV